MQLYFAFILFLFGFIFNDMIHMWHSFDDTRFDLFFALPLLGDSGVYHLNALSQSNKFKFKQFDPFAICWFNFN